MERNVPATTEEQAAEHEPETAEAVEEQPAYRQEISVAFLPLALVTFLFLAFAAAAWTILAAG
jgi:hypothetical protein